MFWIEAIKINNKKRMKLYFLIALFCADAHKFHRFFFGRVFSEDEEKNLSLRY